jgi:hypothetical protein
MDCVIDPAQLSGIPARGFKCSALRSAAGCFGFAQSRPNANNNCPLFQSENLTSSSAGRRLMLDTQNQGPQCVDCSTPMTLTAIEPGGFGQDLRTFTCPNCQKIERHIIDSAVTEAWIEPQRASHAMA